MLTAVLVFYSEEAEEVSVREERLPEWYSSKKETKLSSRILQAKYELLNFPFGREHAGRPKAATAIKEFQLDLEPLPVPPPIKLKTECCEKYLKGKRCGRCPCFDLPYGPASLSN